MDLTFSKKDQDFRAKVRDWIRTNKPKEPRPDGSVIEAAEYDKAWQKVQYKAGWAGISWPVEFGGRGLPLIQQMIWHEEYAKADAPDIGVGFVGMNHAGPTLIVRGNDAQRSAHLPRILSGDEVWCQGFSEPGAGSDLASLRTRGVIDGDHLVVTGQKVWTSYAEAADFQELLVRTDPHAPKHAGISWVICDMRAPGVEVRPLRIATGHWHFCEVFYDAVRIPLTSVVGEVNDGWSVARSTLSFERGTAFIADQMALVREVEELIAFAKVQRGPDGKRPAIADDEFATRLGQARSEAAALVAMSHAMISRGLRSAEPGPEGSIVRLYYSELAQRVHRLGMEMLGVGGRVLAPENDESIDWAHGYINSFRRTIAAGTKDIQRNIIADRGLGLPKG